MKRKMLLIEQDRERTGGRDKGGTRTSDVYDLNYSKRKLKEIYIAM